MSSSMTNGDGIEFLVVRGPVLRGRKSNILTHRNVYGQNGYFAFPCHDGRGDEGIDEQQIGSKC